jgi:hypothetical protein
MFVSGSAYGISGSGFQLGSTDQIAGWGFNATALSASTNSGASGVSIGSDSGTSAHTPYIALYGKNDGSTFMTLGGYLFNGSWNDNMWGMVIRAGGQNLFQCFADQNGNNLTASVAGWNFNASQLSSAGATGGDGTFGSGITLNSGGWISAPNFVLGTSVSKIAGFGFNTTTLSASSSASQIIGGIIRTAPAGQSRVELNGATNALNFIHATGGSDDFTGSIAAASNAYGAYITAEVGVGSFSVHNATGNYDYFVRAFPGDLVVSTYTNGILSYSIELQAQSTEQLKIHGVQVLGQQQAAVAHATSTSDVVARLNDLIDRCRSHGLISL